MSLQLRDAGVTAREAEVLEALGGRLTNTEIAERLSISVRTVESHVSALLRKLFEPDRRALAARARELFPAEVPPLPVTLATATAGPPFVGREEAMARLDELADSVREDGVRRAVLVVGEAGVGKSRLAAELATRLHAEGAVVVHGRCEQDVLTPYQALVEATRPLAPGVQQLLTRPTADAGDDRGDRYRSFEEFDHVLSSRRAPAVLVLDDVQWMDPSGIRLLEHVLHRIDRSPLLVLMTARPEATDPRHPLALAWDRVPTVEVIGLDGLSLADAERLAASIPRSEPARVEAAWERSAGNPFLLTELLRPGTNTDDLPATARDALLRRVAGLGPAVYEALSTAAVTGDVFHPSTVTNALRGDSDSRAEAVERAFSAGLVEGDPSADGKYRFVHALVREALLDVTSPDQRSRLHLQIAEALESRGPGAQAEAARHRHAALPRGDAARARQSALAAFDQAMDDRAYEVAVTLADWALDAIAAGAGEGPDRADALLRRGTALVRSGNIELGTADCRLALEEANRHGLARLRAEAVLGLAAAAPAWGRQPFLREAIQHALDAGVDDVGVRAQLKARLAQQLYYDDAQAVRYQLSREAIDDARASGRADTLATVLATMHTALWEPAHLDERTTVAHEIVATARAAGQPELELQGLGRLAVDRLEGADVSGAEDAFAEHAAIARRLHQRLATRDVELWSAMRSALAGALTDAADHAERARDLGEAARDPGAEVMYWVQRYWIAVEGGDGAAMDAVVERCERIARENTEVPAWRAALAMLHTRRGDLDEARRHYEPLAEGEFGMIRRDVVWLNAMTYLAETCAALDDGERAPILLDLLAPYSGRVAIIDRALACKGSVHRFVGLLARAAGDVEGARAHLAAALTWHEAVGATLLAQRTEADLARLDASLRD